MNFDPYTYQPNVGVWYGARAFNHAQVVASFSAWLKRASPATWRALQRERPDLLAPVSASPAGSTNMKGLGDVPGTSNADYTNSIDSGAGTAVDTTTAAPQYVTLFSDWAREIFGYAQANAESKSELDQVKAQLAAAEQGRLAQEASTSKTLIVAGAFFLGLLALAKVKRAK